MKNNEKIAFKHKRIFFLDLDGTVYLGDRLIPGADKFLETLRKHKIDYYFLSNNSSRSKEDYVDKLRGMGIHVELDKIILSTDGVIEFLKKENIKNTYVLGTRSMKNMFEQAGIEAESDDPDYVVLGYDTELTYEKLKTASLFLIHGKKLLAAHCDIVCPSHEGPLPDVGAMLALIEKATGKVPERIFGKPNPEMVEHILEKHKASADDIVIVGDRIYTDMEMAKNLNCDFILVLSGETKAEDLSTLSPPPFLVVDSLSQLA
jgi:HAD superfamily hydrolase (TIGR01450 family)